MSNRPQFMGPSWPLLVVLPIVAESPNLELVGWIRTLRQNGEPLDCRDTYDRQLRRIRARERQKRAR